MRIAIVAHSAARAGGVETYLSRVIPALAGRGHDVASWFESTVPGAEAVVPASHRGPVWIAVPGGSDLLRPLRAWRPDIIYLHGLRSVELEQELTTIAPVAFFAHSYYGACISGEKSTRFPILSPCDRAFGAACLVHYLPRRCGGLNPITMFSEYETQSRKRALLEKYRAVIVASGHMSREYAVQGVTASIVPLPVTGSETSAHLPRTDVSPASRPRAWNLLYLGRLERSKGVDIALQSAAIAATRVDAPIHVVIAGQGSDAASLRHDAALAGAEPRFTVDFPGWLDDVGRASALAAADLLLVPSVWPEPFGLVGVEAAGAGLPAIAFNVGGIEDWLSDGVNGRLVTLDSHRVQRFADAIVCTLSDPAGLAAMRNHALAAAARFTMAAHLKALEPILVQAARSGQAHRSIDRPA